MKSIILILLMLASAVAASDLRPTLIGGQYAEVGDYPEVIYISSGTSRCSASIIGPKVILTASHCLIAEGSEIKSASFVVGQDVFKAKCKQAPLYRDKIQDHDMALCKIDREIKVKYAIISDHGPEVGDMVQMSGFGCTRQGGGGGNDGRLKHGQAEVTHLPNLDRKNHWFYTKSDVALCFGDSGGSSFLKLSDPKSERHYQIGVNSRGNIKDRSLMTNLWEKPSQDFLKDFAEEQDVQICGINLDCVNDEEPDPRPKPECKRENRKMNYYNKKVIKWGKRLKACEMEDEKMLRLPLLIQ